MPAIETKLFENFPKSMKTHSFGKSIRARMTMLALVAGACIALGAGGCSVGMQSHTDTTGSYISPQTLGQIGPSQTKEYVLALLGEPTVKKPAGGTIEIWEWSWVQKQVTSGDLPLLVGTASNTESKHTAYVQFDNGTVAKVWRD